MGDYRLIELLGEGGLGQVWRVQHELFEEVDLALKVMHERHVLDEAKRVAFANEIKAMARIDHPGVVKIFDAGTLEEDGDPDELGASRPTNGPYFIMEMARDGSLFQNALALDLDAILGLSFAALDALGHAHARGVIHRDIKPANLLVGWEGQASVLKISDFGLSNVYGEDDAALGWGTPDYMAPEQLSGRWREQGPWTDLFALGSMLHEFITGKRPYTLGSLSGIAQIDGARSWQPSRIDGFDEELEAWLERMVARDPRARFMCAAEASWTLARAAGLSEPLGWDAANTLLGMSLERAKGPARNEPVKPIATTVPHDVTPSRPEHTPPEALIIDITPPPWTPTWRAGIRGVEERPSLLFAPRIHHLREIRESARIHERDRLWSALSRVIDSEHHAPRVMLLEGPRGVGKSRLAGWFVKRVRELGVARHLAVRYSDPIGPFDGLLVALAEMLAVQGLEGQRLRRALARAPRGFEFLELDELERVATLLESQHHFSSRRRELSHLDRYEVIGSLLERASATRPIVITVENAHLGSEVLFFIRYLLRRPVLSMRVLFLLMPRQDELEQRDLEAALLEEISVAPGVERLALEPLGEDALVEYLTRNYPLHPDLLQHLVEDTDGVQSNIINLIDDLCAVGAIVRTKSGWTLSGRDGFVDGTKRRWVGRLRRFLELEPTAELSLEIMAALGLESSRQEWEQVCERLGALATPRLVERLGLLGLLRGEDERRLEMESESLQEELERRARERGRWRSINMCIASSLSHDEPERRANHYLAADIPIAAIEDLIAAATRRLARGELLRTHTLLDRLEAILATLGEDHASERELLLARAGALRADCFDLQGRYLEARDVANNVLESATKLGLVELAAQALARHAFALLHSGSTEDAHRCFTQLFDEYAWRSPRAKILAREGLARVAQRRGEIATARAIFLECIEEARALGFTHAEAVCLNGLGDIARQTDDLALAREYSERALALFEEHGHRVMVADCLNDLAELARIEGNYSEALALCQRSISIFESVDSRLSHRARLELAYVSLGQMEFDRARILLERLCLTFYEEKDFSQLALAVVGMLPVLVGRGEIERLGQALEHARRLLERTERRDRDVAFALELAKHIDVNMLSVAQREALLELQAAHSPAASDSEPIE